MRKHAVDASSVQILIRHLSDAVEIEVRDDGRRPTHPGGGPQPVGFGLVGMCERVGLHAGE